MALGERDPHTGHMTTGHEWNGIKELNTPVPKPVWFFLISTAIFSVICWFLLPAWPVGVAYTKGLLGIDQRKTVSESLEEAVRNRSVWTDRVATLDYEEIQADDELMRSVRETGSTLFGDNCAVCHGTDAKGSRGFPNLAEGSWLWGGDAETIAETLRVGINANHAETRASQMLAFGQDGMLQREAIREVVTYVQSLSGPEVAATATAETLQSGEETFATYCASCHGANGEGSTDLGAPDLTDSFWIYGGDRQSIYTSVFAGRQGYMPHWEGRLTALDRKILALYLVDLRSGT